MGRLLLENGNFKEAEIFLKSAVALSANDGLLQNDLGVALLGEGRAIEARLCFKLCLQIGA